MFKLVFEKEDGSFKRYENEYGYKVFQKYLTSDKTIWELSVRKDNALPEIYIEMDDNGCNKIDSIKMRLPIQGLLYSSEVDKIIEDYRKAQETISQIEELIKTL